MTPITATSIAQDVPQFKVKVESQNKIITISSDSSSHDEVDVAYVNPTFSRPHLPETVSSPFTSSTSLQCYNHILYVFRILIFKKFI